MAQLGTLTQTTLLSATTGTLACYLLPIWQKQLLIPTLTVVEIIPAQALKQGKQKKKGYLGQIAWQDKTIPVLSFEIFNDEVIPPEPQFIAVMQSVLIAEKQTHYGIALQGNAQAVKVKISELEDLEKAPVGKMEYLQVRYSENLAVIPDLDALEEKLLAML